MNKRKYQYEFRYRLEFKIEDCWIGVFWRREDFNIRNWPELHIWICLIPMLPLHITRTLKERTDATS